MNLSRSVKFLALTGSGGKRNRMATDLEGRQYVKSKLLQNAYQHTVRPPATRYMYCHGCKLPVVICPRP
jgi:hypothetical protein